MVEKTTDDILARMALFPRTMEARGLDASPPLRAKLAQAGDIAAAEIIDIILADEIGHVLIAIVGITGFAKHAASSLFRPMPRLQKFTRHRRCADLSILKQDGRRDLVKAS